MIKKVRPALLSTATLICPDYITGLPRSKQAGPFFSKMADDQSRLPSEKERKYDRQLRLWAASGQAALESASVLLVNSGSGTVGVETLKNLVLPGVFG